MADQKVSDLPSLNGADVDPADLLYIVDSSAGSAGSKKITVGQYQLAPVSGGTANGVAYLNASKVLTTGSALVFDGSNLGVGTSSPSGKLDVRSGYIVSGTAPSTNGSKILGGYYTSGHLATFGGEYSNGGPVIGYGVWPSTAAAGSFVSSTTLNVQRGAYTILGANHIWYGGDAQTVAIDSAVTTTERMRLDLSGNLGLGVTPSAWGAAYPGRIQGLGWAIATPLDGGTDTSAFATNAYNSAGSTWNYRNNASAALYQQFSGTHRWYTAPSGTAGNAITFTQAMTLDADGELGIGTTSPSAGLDVRKQETSAYNTARFSNGTDVQFLDVVCGRALTNGTVGGVSSSLVMTLRSSGSSSGHLAFATGNDERARITSGGNLLVGKTSEFGQAFRLVVEANSSTSAVPAVFADPRTDAVSAITVAFYRNGSKVGSIDTTNAATSYVTSSDRRLKENIALAADAGPIIDAIEVIEHDWKVGGHTRYGVIAQDLHAIAPEAVSTGDDGEEIERAWGVDYSKLVPMLIKEIQTLRARVAALESA